MLPECRVKDTIDSDFHCNRVCSRHYLVIQCDASKWRLGLVVWAYRLGPTVLGLLFLGLPLLLPGTIGVVPGLPPLELEAVVPARHSLGSTA